MERRLSEVEGKLETLTKTLQQIAERVQALERERAVAAPGPATHGAPARESPAPPPGEPAVAKPAAPPPPTAWEELFPAGIPVLQLVSLTGQVFLILGGAYLLRALTSSESLPLGLGLGAGFLYALAWLVAGDVCGRRDKALCATFYGTAAAMIAYPLAWEATTKFEFLSGAAAAAATGGFTLFALGLAWLRKLPVLAWLVTLGSVLTSTVLVLSTHVVEPHLLVALLLGLATIWIAYGRRWSGLAWPAAIGADLLCLFAVLLAARLEGPPESYAGLSTTAVLALSLSLPFVYVASFAVQTLLRQKDVRVFEMLQTGIALIVGLGGAVHIASAVGYGSAWLGGLTLVLAATSYAVAFLFTGLRWKHRMNFLYYAWLALILTVAGCSQVSGGVSAPLLWCGLTVAAAFLGISFRRLTLHYHSAVYAVVAAVAGGLLADGVSAFLSPSAGPVSPPSLASLAAFGGALVSFVAMAGSKADPRRVWGTRVPRLTVAAVAMLGGATLTMIALRQAVGGGAEQPDAAFVALLRTAVLATFAVVLTFVGRGHRFTELRWLLYPLIVFGGIKIMVEDLPVGRAATLFPAFGLYGITLILAARMVQHLRGASAAPASAESEPSQPSGGEALAAGGEPGRSEASR